MPKYVDVESLHFPNICIFDMTLHGETVPMVRLVDLQKLVTTSDVVEVVRCCECIYHDDESPYHYCRKWRRNCPDDSDFFCKWGSRKDARQDNV